VEGVFLAPGQQELRVGVFVGSERVRVDHTVMAMGEEEFGVNCIKVKIVKGGDSLYLTVKD